MERSIAFRFHSHSRFEKARQEPRPPARFSNHVWQLAIDHRQFILGFLCFAPRQASCRGYPIEHVRRVLIEASDYLTRSFGISRTAFEKARRESRPPRCSFRICCAGLVLQCAWPVSWAALLCLA